MAIFNDDYKLAARHCTVKQIRPQNSHVEIINSTTVLTTFARDTQLKVNCEGDWGLTSKSGGVELSKKTINLELVRGTRLMTIDGTCKVETEDAVFFTGGHRSGMMADEDVGELTRLRKLDFLNLVDGLNGTSLNLAMRLIPPEDRRVVNLRDEYKYAWIAQVCLPIPFFLYPGNGIFKNTLKLPPAQN